MAQSKLSNSDYEHSLECSICFSDFVQPKQLPCFHIFCLKCLKEYCRPKTDSATCPMCRREFIVPKGGVEQLPNNELVMRLVLQKGLNNKHEQSKCEVCAIVGEDMNAKSFCMECQQCLCVRCQKCHSAETATKTHSVVGIEERPSKEELRQIKSSFCLWHPEEKEMFYCCDCSKVICCLCHVQNHNKHNCKLFKEVIQRKKDLFLKNNKCIERCLNEGSNKLKQLQKEREKILSEVTDATRSIDKTFNDVMKLISLHKTKLLSSLERTKAKRLKEIESQEDLDQFYNTELNSFLLYGRMVMERGTDCEILRVVDELHKRAQELIKSHDERNKQPFSEYSIKFVASQKPTQESLSKLVGDLIDTDKAKLFLRSNLVRMVESVNLRYMGFGRRACKIEGVTVIDGKIFVVQEHLPYVKVYDSRTLRAQSDSEVHGMKKPQGLAGCSYNKVLYINDYEIHCIHTINLNDKSIKCWRLQGYYSPGCVSVTSEQNVLVTGLNASRHGYSKASHVILNYTSEGQLIEAIKLDDSITGECQIVQHSSDQFIICHWSEVFRNRTLHGLHVINSKGEIIKSYGRDKEGGEEQLNMPSALAMDSKSKVLFVADRGNKRVLLFSRDLCFLGQVQTAGQLSSPSYIYYDSSSSRLIVGDSSDFSERLIILGLTVV